MSQTVYVLGAGFTKAFLPSAPLLIDDYGGQSLLNQFQGFPYVRALVELEMNHSDHSVGLINIERLMTRLVSEMPHDYGTESQHVFAEIVSELKRWFRKRLFDAQSHGLKDEGELRLFAGHCLQTKSTCITFNYDDMLDETFWSVDPRYWTPDSGYGFPCRMSESCIRDTAAAIAEPGQMLLLKLHGSMNWRIPLGYPKPYVIEAVRHHEPWFQHNTSKPPKIDIEMLDNYLEAEPMIVPPVLTKTDLNNQPVLRLVWKMACDALEHADRVVFLGYSLPITDIAVGFLFREGLDHLSRDKVSVIDSAVSEDDRRGKLDQLLRSYGTAKPGITRERFEFCGAASWIRDNLTNWYYNSKGDPVAFDALGWFVSRNGDVIGSRCRRTEVWRKKYLGEIIENNRLFYRISPPTETPFSRVPDPPNLPQPGTLPSSIQPMTPPDGFRDIEGFI